jgi:error-prone DNA polymerase
MTYTHLHTHSCYSLLAGTSRIKALVTHARQLGMSALALTDVNRMSGLIKFYQECKKQGIRPILGVELTEPVIDEGVSAAGQGGYAGEGDSVVLLARDEVGYGDLCEIITQRHIHKSSFTFKSMFSKPWPHLMLISAWPRVLRVLHNTPNRGSLYGELVNHSSATRRRGRQVESICAELGIGLMVSNDVHFLEKGDWGLHRILRAIDLNSTLSRLKAHEYAPPNAFMRSGSQMAVLFPNHGVALANTAAIAASCRVELKLGGWIMPEIEVPVGHKPSSYLALLAHKGLQANYAGGPHYERALAIQEMELGVIQKLGYSSYFLMVKDMRDWANNHFKGRYRRPADCTILRGSAANSITFYNLGVSDLDPIRYDLYFQRFLNEDRASPPDADLDFGWDERDEALEYAVKRFGRERVAITCTTNRFRWRSAFREAAKVFGYSEEQVTLILDSHQTRTRRIEDEEIRRIEAVAERLRGLPRFLGQHPGGVLITNDPIWRHVACERSGGDKDRVITQVDMHSGIDELGLIKFDLLGNGSLSVYRDTLAQLEEQGVPDPQAWDLEKCFRDPAVMRMIREGETRGIFYIESPAQSRLNKKAQAESFEEITVTSSLVRPAGAAYTKVYVERHRKMKAGIVDWNFLHPSLKPILGDTHDVCAFQEDVIKICHEVAGLSFKKADTIRKMMNSLHEGVPQGWHQVSCEFVEGCMSTNGLSREQAVELWERVSSFSGFSFCKSHSATYAQLSFQCAYLKAHYPAQFLAAVISNGHGFYSREVYLTEARRWGVKILPFSVNESRKGFLGRGLSIRPGFMHIKGFSSRSLGSLLKERERGGPYQDLADFVRRSGVGHKDTQSLIQVGALDSFGLTQPESLYMLDSVYKGGVRGTNWLFPQEAVSRPKASLSDYTLAEKCLNELRILGYMLSGDILNIMELHPSARGAVPFGDVPRHVGGRVKVFGQRITSRLHHVARGGKIMQFLTLGDRSGYLDIIFWPDVYERYADVLLESGPFEVHGRVTEDWGTFNVEASFVKSVAWSPNQVDLQLASEKLKQFSATSANHMGGYIRAA